MLFLKQHLADILLADQLFAQGFINTKVEEFKNHKSPPAAPLRWNIIAHPEMPCD